MGRTGGGSELRGALRKLEQDLENYFGALNELSMGLPGLTVKVPEKPKILAYIEQFEQLHTPFVSGGLFDQPYILMEMVNVVFRVRNMMELIRAREQAAMGASNDQQTGSMGGFRPPY